MSRLSILTARKEQDSYFLSPLEIFLQLSTEGKREQEAASLMIKKLLEFKLLKPSEYELKYDNRPAPRTVTTACAGTSKR